MDPTGLGRVPGIGPTEGSRDKVRNGSHGGSSDGPHRVSRDGPTKLGRVPGIILQD